MFFAIIIAPLRGLKTAINIWIIEPPARGELENLCGIFGQR